MTAIRAAWLVKGVARVRQWRLISNSRQRAREALADAFPPGRWEIRPLSTTAPKASAGRIVFACFAPGRVPVVVKTFEKFKEAQNQVLAHRAVRAAGSVVQPIFERTDLGCLGFRLIEGPLLGALLFGRRHEEGLVAAGRAIREYHDAVGCRPTDPSVDLIREELRAWSREKLDLPHAGVINDLADRRQRAAERDPHRVHAHFDCKPGNFIVSEEGIRMIDRPRGGTDWIETDVANFLANLALRRAVANQGEIPGGSDYLADEAVFLSAYGYPDARREKLALAMNCGVFRTWLRGGRRGVGSPAERAALELWVKQIVRDNG